MDQESNTAKSGGHTCALWTHPSAQRTKEIVQNLTEYTQLTKNVYFLDLMILYYLWFGLIVPQVPGSSGTPGTYNCMFGVLVIRDVEP